MINVNLPFTSITKRDDGVWVFTWDDTGADYYRVVYRGHFITKVGAVGNPSTTYIHEMPGSSPYPPHIEVVEKGKKALTEQNVPFLRIQWIRVHDAVAYRIDKWNGAAWAKDQTVAQNDNAFVYSIDTPILDDVTEYQYRVRAMDLLEQFSTALEFTIFVVRPPNFLESDVDVYYTAAGTTITVAAP